MLYVGETRRKKGETGHPSISCRGGMADCSVCTADISDAVADRYGHSFHPCVEGWMQTVSADGDLRSGA